VKIRLKFHLHIYVLIGAFAGYGGCSKPSGSGNETPPPNPGPSTSDISYWLTKSDQSVLMTKQLAAINFSSAASGSAIIEVDSTQQFQTVDGFGYTLTGGSAQLINGLSSSAKQALLQELFSTSGIGISYLRISIGSSDLDDHVFSYDDMPAGQTDPSLANFTLSSDQASLIPVLQQIIQINPSVTILGSPWSPPTWMKTNNSSIGGSLLPAYYSSYAQYFIKYLQGMQSNGIHIDAITIQNEPLHGGNNPSMLMMAAEQAAFIKNYLGPAFQSAGIDTKIIVWDHNCDNPAYPIDVLNDPAAKAYVDGSAFHLYGGDISALSQVKTAHPDRNLYFTEQYTSSGGVFGTDLRWHVRNVIIGSMRNWSRNALEWNLANDAAYGPHTAGGCTVCRGALTISGSSIQRNVSYYIIAHASAFVPGGSKRIYSSVYGNLYNVAFLRPDGKKVLIVLNDATDPQAFNIKFKNKWAPAVLEGGSVATYVW
jgi:glucosylceramidase